MKFSVSTLKELNFFNEISSLESMAVETIQRVTSPINWIIFAKKWIQCAKWFIAQKGEHDQFGVQNLHRLFFALLWTKGYFISLMHLFSRSNVIFRSHLLRISLLYLKKKKKNLGMTHLSLVLSAPVSLSLSSLYWHNLLEQQRGKSRLGRNSNDVDANKIRSHL